MNQKIKSDEERIKDIIGMIFLSVLFIRPVMDNMRPVAVKKNVI